MAERTAVNVWFDSPGDFLEIGWSNKWAVRSQSLTEAQFEIEIHLTEDSQATGFHIISPVHFSDLCHKSTLTSVAVEPFPITVNYEPDTDLWDVQWGPDPLDCVESPNPRIKAMVDAEGQIQGVLISGLRTLEGEILNQDLYPVKPGAATA